MSALEDVCTSPRASLSTELLFDQGVAEVQDQKGVVEKGDDVFDLDRDRQGDFRGERHHAEKDHRFGDDDPAREEDKQPARGIVAKKDPGAKHKRVEAARHDKEEFAGWLDVAKPCEKRDGQDGDDADNDL